MDNIKRAEYSRFMHALADEADTIARRWFARPIAHEAKADASPVTQADREIEAALIERIRAAYPDHGIFGEESARIRPDAPMQWVIDPIDGTRAFIAGRPSFVTLIALCVEGKPACGLISQPIQRRRWAGGDGLSAKADETTTNLEDARLSTTSLPYFNAAQAAAFGRLEAATRHAQADLDGLAYGLLANGELEMVIDAALKPYDFCALVPVVEQAGGVISDWSGQPLNLHSAGDVLAACNKTLHRAALDLLNVHS